VGEEKDSSKICQQCLRGGTRRNDSERGEPLEKERLRRRKNRLASEKEGSRGTRKSEERNPKWDPVVILAGRAPRGVSPGKQGVLKNKISDRRRIKKRKERHPAGEICGRETGTETKKCKTEDWKGLLNEEPRERSKAKSKCRNVAKGAEGKDKGKSIARKKGGKESGRFHTLVTAGEKSIEESKNPEAEHILCRS